MSHTSLTPYRPPSTSPSTSTSLIPLLTPQSIFTELLYRLLFSLLNRALTSLHRFAITKFDSLGGFLERKWGESREARREAEKRIERGGVVREVEKRGGWGGREVCPLTGREGGMGGGRMGGRRGPPGWVGEVLSGIEEGRLVEGDFWGHPFGN